MPRPVSRVSHCAAVASRVITYHSVDYIRQDADTQPVHSDNIRRGCCTRETAFEGCDELCIIVWHEDTDGQATQNEECRETVENSVKSFWHDFAWILALACCHGDVVWTSDGEGRLDQALQKPEESSETACVVELCKCTWIIPVAKSNFIIQRIASEHSDEGENDQTHNQQDFAQSKPLVSISLLCQDIEVGSTYKLGFSIPFNSKDVDDSIEHYDDRNDTTCWDCFRPIVNDHITCDNLERNKGSLEDKEVVSLTT